MTKREEIKKVLRENTKDAFRAIKLNMGSKREFTAKELADMTDGRLSAQSISGFFAKNGPCIVDRASSNEFRPWDIEVNRCKSKRDKVKTYVNVENPNDYITIRRTENVYTINDIFVR